MAAFTVLYDACVLYPAPLRDLLMELAQTRLFHARWTDEIHNEWISKLAENRPDIAEKLQRTRELMNKAVPDCLVCDYQDLVPGLTLPDPEDRHVLAAAIRCGASVVVTSNLKHFPAEYLNKFGIDPQHPDEFISNQFDLNPPVACGAIKRVRQRLKKPPKTLDEYIDTLAQQSLPRTVYRMKAFETLI